MLKIRSEFAKNSFPNRCIKNFCSMLLELMCLQKLLCEIKKNYFWWVFYHWLDESKSSVVFLWGPVWINTKYIPILIVIIKTQFQLSKINIQFEITFNYYLHHLLVYILKTIDVIPTDLQPDLFFSIHDRCLKSWAMITISSVTCKILILQIHDLLNNIQSKEQ